MSIKIGTKVEVIGKGVVGTVAYIGATLFSSGKWVGVILDDAKGKNNGTVQGKKYFTCEDNHGIFVRQSQIAPIDGSSGESPSTPGEAPQAATPTSEATPARPPPSEKKQGRISGLRPPSKVSSREDLAQAAKGKDGSPTTPAEEEALGSKVESKRRSLSQTTDGKKKRPLSQASAADISVMSASIDSQMSSLQQQQEVENYKADIKDLEEKLETLKLKRAEDKVKLKEFEKAKIQLQQLQEYKTKMQELQTDLQRQLQASKKEAKDAQEAYDRYKDEMSDLAETVEIATLDKEMAEEKCENLQLEVDSLKEKVEELTLDLEIMKEDLSKSGTEGGATNYQVKQMEQQNERLKEALVKMRDLSNQEKQELSQLKKQLDLKTTEINNLTKDKDRLTEEVKELQDQILEIQEQVDAATGAEEMVENLTDRNLALEERIQELEEERADLEALHEMNEELQETAREGELELREELDLTRAKVHEAQRKLDATQETIADYESTIAKFRELVAQLQEANQELMNKQVETVTQKQAPPIEMFDFKSKLIETKAFAKAIDMEIRQLDVKQANKHVSLLCSFMPESFIRRGGDHDALLALLLIPRLIQKADLLINQARSKFEAPESITREQVLKSPKAEQYSYGCQFVHMLSILQNNLHQYESALNTCSVELFLKVGTLLPEMAIHEKHLDHYIELLRKDQLDETVSLENLERSISYFHHLYSVHLAQEKVDQTVLMADHVKQILNACDCVSVDITRLKLLLQPKQETSDISILLKDLESYCNDTRLAARKIKRRVPQQAQESMSAPLSYGKEVQESILACGKNMNHIVKVLHLMGGEAMKQVALITDSDGVPVKKMEEISKQSVNKVFSGATGGPAESLRKSFKSVVDVVSKVAQAVENGEYDFDGTSDTKPMPPVMTRANQVKGEISDTENLKYKIEAKDEDIKELKKQLKLKQDELSQQQIRYGMMDKKLENASKDGNEKIEKLQRKLDDANAQLKKKEKEFEETMDALQADIDALENEKAELKERLRVLSKKTLLEGLAKQSGVAALVTQGSPELLRKVQGATGSTSPSSPTAGIPGPAVVRDSPLLLQEIDSLKMALKHLKNENVRLKGQKMMDQLASLPPLRVPKKPVGLASTTGLIKMGEAPEGAHGIESLNRLSKKTSAMLHELQTLSACPTVVDISKRKPGQEPLLDKASPANQLLENAARMNQLQRSTLELQVAVTNLMAANRNGGQVRTDFAAFPTPSFAKVLHEKTEDKEMIGRVTLPTTAGQGDTIPISVLPNQLRKIHAKFVS
ncbi:dynactin subunit 1 isoform X3 [Lingula anatina]|uniref:Dynactin subunit 1 n=1 Tax=Lingula anatina TaxID=7574 RepID=A0A1S3JRS7_LINAN|nr:dynactin subunit 1 isoform X3 [Lingula anatina]|eukprot:XP_013412801.1 dynactin subunit 1 isoform X3 [Lingula anatina]